MTSNDRNSCSITLVFTGMGTTRILLIRTDSKIAVGCHTMLIKSCARITLQESLYKNERLMED